jgi:diguanylate cyclase (GGDEF)-like protein
VPSYPCPLIAPAPARTDRSPRRRHDRESRRWPSPSSSLPLRPPTAQRLWPARPDPVRLGLFAGTGLALLTAAALLALQRRMRSLRLRLASAQYEARHDRLTGLPDLRCALDHLSSTPVALVGLLDLDDFKSVNDRYGHPTGDRLLVAVAERLRTAMRGHGIAARLSGDEFALLWWSGLADPLRQAGLLLEHLSTPVRLDTHLVLPRASLGLARPGPHLRGPALLAAADHAMYEAKSTGRRAARSGGPSARSSSRWHLYAGAYPPAPVDRRAGPDRRGTRT